MDDMAHAIIDLATRYYNQCNYEAPFFHTQYTLNFADPYIFNGHPPIRCNESQMDWNRIIMIKLKDMFHDGRVVKYKQLIQDQLGYQISFNDYIRLTLGTLYCTYTKAELSQLV